MVGGEQLGELGRQLLPLGEAGEVAVVDLVVEGLVDVVGLTGTRRVSRPERQPRQSWQSLTRAMVMRAASNSLIGSVECSYTADESWAAGIVSAGAWAAHTLMSGS